VAQPRQTVRAKRGVRRSLSAAKAKTDRGRFVVKGCTLTNAKRFLIIVGQSQCARNYPRCFMHFDSVSPSAVRSVRQQDFLKVWFRLFTRLGQLPSLADFNPSRIEDEKPELMYYDVVHTGDEIRYPVIFAGQRLIEAYGFNAVGRDLQDILSPTIWTHVESLYDQCVLRGMPTYSVFTVVDVHNDVVAYERLLLPFGEANVVKQIIASIKSISTEGRFVNTDLMRSKDHDPQYSLRAVVDQCAPDKVTTSWADDVVEI